MPRASRHPPQRERDRVEEHSEATDISSPDHSCCRQNRRCGRLIEDPPRHQEEARGSGGCPARRQRERRALRERARNAAILEGAERIVKTRSRRSRMCRWANIAMGVIIALGLVFAFYVITTIIIDGSSPLDSLFGQKDYIDPRVVNSNASSNEIPAAAATTTNPPIRTTYNPPISSSTPIPPVRSSTISEEHIPNANFTIGLDGKSSSKTNIIGTKKDPFPKFANTSVIEQLENLPGEERVPVQNEDYQYDDLDDYGIKIATNDKTLIQEDYDDKYEEESEILDQIMSDNHQMTTGEDELSSDTTVNRNGLLYTRIRNPNHSRSRHREMTEDRNWNSYPTRNRAVSEEDDFFETRAGNTPLSPRRRYIDRSFQNQQNPEYREYDTLSRRGISRHRARVRSSEERVSPIKNYPFRNRVPQSYSSDRDDQPKNISPTSSKSKLKSRLKYLTPLERTQLHEFVRSKRHQQRLRNRDFGGEQHSSHSPPGDFRYPLSATSIRDIIDYMNERDIRKKNARHKSTHSEETQTFQLSPGIVIGEQDHVVGGDVPKLIEDQIHHPFEDSHSDIQVKEQKNLVKSEKARDEQIYYSIDDAPVDYRLPVEDPYPGRPHHPIVSSVTQVPLRNFNEGRGSNSYGMSGSRSFGPARANFNDAGGINSYGMGGSHSSDVREINSYSMGGRHTYDNSESNIDRMRGNQGSNSFGMGVNHAYDVGGRNSYRLEENQDNYSQRNSYGLGGNLAYDVGGRNFHGLGRNQEEPYGIGGRTTYDVGGSNFHGTGRTRTTINPPNLILDIYPSEDKSQPSNKLKTHLSFNDDFKRESNSRYGLSDFNNNKKQELILHVNLFSQPLPPQTSRSSFNHKGDLSLEVPLTGRITPLDIYRDLLLQSRLSPIASAQTGNTPVGKVNNQQDRFNMDLLSSEGGHRLYEAIENGLKDLNSLLPENLKVVLPETSISANDLINVGKNQFTTERYPSS